MQICRTRFLSIQICQITQGSDITIKSKAGDNGDARFGCYGVSANFFALINIADVHLNGWEVTACQCVSQCEAGMGESAGIDDQAENFRVRKFTDLINDETFVVGLIKFYV